MPDNNKKYEALLYHTLVGVNDLTKSNITTNLMTAASSGSLAIDEYLLKQVVTIVNSTVDQSVDIIHGQVLRIKSTAATGAERKKPAARKKPTT
jgi:hypothetical protein